MLYPTEATKINNTNKSYSPLEKDNEPEIDFVVNTNDFCFDKTVLKNDVVKPNVVTKPDDNGGAVTTRPLRRKAAEKADLKIKHCH